MMGQIYLITNVKVCVEFRNLIIKALEDKYNAEVSQAHATIAIYLSKSVGIGEHPQHVEEVDKLCSVMGYAYTVVQPGEIVIPRAETLDNDLF